MKQVGKMPKTFQGKIMERFMGEKGLASFAEDYRNARKRQFETRPPTQQEVHLGNLVKELGYAMAAKKVGLEIKQVYSIINRVSKHDFFFGASVATGKKK